MKYISSDTNVWIDYIDYYNRIFIQGALLNVKHLESFYFGYHYGIINRLIRNNT